jgi:PAS domain S-box-containing protein
MKDNDKTQKQLIKELTQLRRRIAELEKKDTERKRAEEALRQSEATLRALINAPTDSVLLLDRRGVILDLNKIAAERIGKSRDELIGTLADDSLPEDIAKRRRSIISQIFETSRVVRFEDERDGIWYDTVVHPITDKDGAVSRLAIIARDITERKQAEEALHEANEMLRAMLEAAPVAIFDLDTEGIVQNIWNPAAERLLGWSRQEALGHFLPSVPEEGRGEFREFRERIRSGRSLVGVDVRRQRKDGSPIDYSIYAAPLYDVHGQVKGNIAVLVDITERKQAEEKLRESEERFRTVFESAEDIIFIKDRDLRFTFVNPAMERDHGVPASKLIGKRSKALFGEERSANIMEDDLRVLSGETINKEQFSPLKGRSAVHHLIKVPIHNSAGEIVGLCGIARDITERKQAEEKLRESESRYRALFDSASDAIFIIDQTTAQFIDVNQVVCERLGYSREELLQMTPLDIDSPEYALLVRERIETLHQRGHLFFETVHVRRDGTTIPTETSSRIITYAGKPAVISIARDITERKQAEEKLHRSYQQMREMLVTTVNALAATVEMKDQYTAGHQPRATHLACAIAEEIGLPPEQIEGIRMAGSVHDIGKIVVPAEILNKPGPLTEVQYEMVKMHPRASYDILKGIAFPWPVAQIVLQHHELMDGSGYPQGLSGEQIILEARILTIANVVEAMTAHRPHREAHSIETALEEISRNKGKLYDPVASDACLKLFTEKRFTFD